MITFKPISFQQKESLSVAEIATDGSDSVKYTSCDRAIKQGFLTVQEVSDQGSVNTVLVVNSSDEYVFMMDGDILLGAKQTRVLNTSVFIAPKSKTLIPVSCVERGRWRPLSPKFHSSDYTAPVFMRASKSSHIQESLKNREGHFAKQGEVWREVDEYHARHQTISGTASLSDMFDQKRGEFDAFVAGFTPSDKANGFVTFIHDRILNLEIFNRRDIHAEYFPRILKGVAVEAFGLKPRKIPLDENSAGQKIAGLLSLLEEIPTEIHPGVALGTERRFGNEEITGFDLLYNDHRIHLTAMNLKQGDRG